MTSRVWYVVAAVLFAAGGAGAGWTLWSGFSRLGASIERVVVPGSGELVLDKPGSYTIYHERSNLIDGRLTEVPTIAGMTVTIIDEEGGASIPVRKPSYSANYTMGGHSGVSVLAFDAPHPGRYRLTGTYDSGGKEPRTVLAVDLGLFGGAVRTVATAFGVAGAATLAALAIVLTTFFRRRKMLSAAPSRQF
ncbi:MAG TPA: hypothetical protein VMI30_01985 [Stellaceae bacterium]|nr:hypothetical protein [Stellaceae bacterium]